MRIETYSYGTAITIVQIVSKYFGRMLCDNNEFENNLELIPQKPILVVSRNMKYEQSFAVYCTFLQSTPPPPLNIAALRYLLLDSVC